MNLFADLRTTILDALDQMAHRSSPAHSTINLDPDTINNIVVEPPRNPAHGDMATNAAMIAARLFKQKPALLAEQLIALLQGDPRIESIEIAGPGFINMTLRSKCWHDFLHAIFTRPDCLNPAPITDQEKINIEYVSANPTGPLHLGHTRGAVFGDALANLLQACGWDVTREYYVNDGGGQIDTLVQSAAFRYREAAGINQDHPGETFYPGDYLISLAKELLEQQGDRFDPKENLSTDPAFRDHVVGAMLDLIRSDLASLAIHHDVFTHERNLIESGAVDEAFAELTRQNLIYTGILDAPKGKRPDEWEPTEQVLFKSTKFGDDTDRPLKKSDGSWTYFASDIACHFDKFKRGFNQQINIFGADHAGYIKRLQSATRAVCDGQASLEILVCQTVRLIEQSVPVKMSKRAGRFVTLHDLTKAVGKDAIRFLMMMRRHDAPLDFDLDLARTTSRDNPVFYVQYAHARTWSLEQSMRRQLGDRVFFGASAPDRATLGLLDRESEFAIIRKLAEWVRMIEAAGRMREPHRIAYYLVELAGLFHHLWNSNDEAEDGRLIIPDNPKKSQARTALVLAVRMVLARGLDMLSIEPVQALH
ncbi:MAG: arginine--tRNA ligase [Pseudomonadota bacterium]